MLIRVNTISGIKPTDLGNINGLNHYIGMKAIDPEAIPVLAIMPWVVGGLVIGALLVAAVGMRALLVVWLAAFAIAGAAGMAEFYLWSYDYGHNLASDAVIKVPGMTYQPPLIGSKQLLNFTAASWPATGSWLALAAFVLGVVALWPFAKRLKVVQTTHAIAALAVALMLPIGGCRSAEPRDIAYGRADCHVCRMRIVDNRFGGEVVTHTGKVYEFDSIECLANYAAANVAEVRSTWVSDFERPGTLISASTALYIRKRGASAGMGADLLAIAPTSDLARARERFGVEPMTWSTLRDLAARHELQASPRA
jgi:copper chaperone NosL